MSRQLNTLTELSVHPASPITQTAPIGFSEVQVEFQSKPKSKPTLSPVVQQQVHETARGVTDQNLRRALEELGRNVLTKNQTKNTPH